MFQPQTSKIMSNFISGISVKIHAVGTPKKCISKALRVDSTCRIHNILSKIIWSIRFLVVHTILNRWILPSSTFAFNELRNFLRNKKIFHVGQFFGRVLDNMTQSIERQN